MANPDTTGRTMRVNRRYLLDRPSQLQFSMVVLLVVSGIGLLYAVAIYYLVDSDLLRGRSTDEIRTVLLLVHVAYFMVCGILLFSTVLLLTHRFVGPAYVMRSSWPLSRSLPNGTPERWRSRRWDSRSWVGRSRW